MDCVTVVSFISGRITARNRKEKDTNWKLYLTYVLVINIVKQFEFCFIFQKHFSLYLSPPKSSLLHISLRMRHYLLIDFQTGHLEFFCPTKAAHRIRITWKNYTNFNS